MILLTSLTSKNLVSWENFTCAACKGAIYCLKISSLVEHSNNFNNFAVSCYSKPINSLFKIAVLVNDRSLKKNGQKQSIEYKHWL